MAYIVNRTDGSVVATIADGTIDTANTSITLLGKGYNNYGEIVAENWVKMLEHFALSTPPSNPMRGQLWFDVSSDKLKVNVSDGTPNWVVLGDAIVSATAPVDGFNTGAFWYDSANEVLNISVDGSSFTPIRLVATGSGEPTPPNGHQEGDLWYDTTTKQLKVYNADLHGTGVGGFDVVGPARHSGSTPPTDGNLKDGDEWWNTNTKQLFVYDETNSQFRLIGPMQEIGVGPSATTTTEYLVVDNNALIAIRVNGDIVGIWSQNDFTPSALIDGFHDDTITDIKRGLNLSPKSGPNSEQTLLQGLSTKAQYADLAERYAVDSPVEPGDLVSLGGNAEVTKTTEAFDVNIFGVVSTSPGFVLNELAGPNETHPYIALAGRVPCKVVGPVKKGDRLVSSSVPGCAQAISADQVNTHFVAVVGRALETNMDENVKLVEVAVGTK